MAPSLMLDLSSGFLSGGNVKESFRTIGDLRNLFENEGARAALPQDKLVYSVQSHEPVDAGTPGALFFGTSSVFPGQVDGESFLTKGHFPARREAAEYYWCIQGEGALILMDEDRNCWFEAIRPGTLHYIPGRTAHRLANTGTSVLRVGACWPADAGHDYQAIQRDGFSARLKCVDGLPVLIERSERS